MSLPVANAPNARSVAVPDPIAGAVATKALIVAGVSAANCSLGRRQTSMQDVEVRWLTRQIRRRRFCYLYYRRKLRGRW